MASGRNKKIILAAAGIALFFVALFVLPPIPFNTGAPAPEPTEETAVPATRLPLPADSESPAAGVCMDPPAADEARVAVHFDIPSPRCQKLYSHQILVVENATDERGTFWFGDGQEIVFSIEPRGEYLSEEPAGSYLAPGVHALRGAPYSGPELWVMASTTETESAPR